jgi:hypothetical protein
MLTADDLAYTRATANLTLTQRAIVQHHTTGSDGMGGEIDIYAYSDDIPCRVAPMRVQAAESVSAGQLQGNLGWEITLPVGTTIDLTDRLNVGGTLSGTAPNETVTGGRWWEVMAIYGDWTNSSAWQCLCQERSGP